MVDANPSDVEFKWTFNNSAESIDVATNHVTRSGRPDQVHNCTITNISTTSLSVKCSDGFNGGMKQSFMLEVKDMHTQELRVNYTSPEPRFAVSNLEAGHAYIVAVYAFNGKGRSDPTILQTAMLRLPEKQLTSEKERPRSVLALTPMLSVVIGLAAAIVIGGLAIILALRVPCGKRRKRKQITQRVTGEGSPGPSDKSIGSKEIDGNESDEKNPDIIPDTMDSDDQMDYMRRRQHVSTIDTNSPTRGLLSHQGTPPSQTYVPAMPMHAPIGYCTLRNGTKSANIGAPISMSPVPNIYPKPQSTCTLPRHPNQHWPSYGGTIAGVRHLPQVQMCGPQPPPPSQIAMQHLNTRSRMCIGLAEDDTSIDTPLMLKQLNSQKRRNVNRKRKLEKRLIRHWFLFDLQCKHSLEIVDDSPTYRRDSKHQFPYNLPQKFKYNFRPLKSYVLSNQILQLQHEHFGMSLVTKAFFCNSFYKSLKTKNLACQQWSLHQVEIKLARKFFRYLNFSRQK
ncbi:hypothetical protein Bhyg_12521, partial [Pseudolycoriella hygida]